MKKLALALMCLVSVAFFASCNPQGQPTIYVINEDGYVQNGDVVNLGEEVNFGFAMASAIETSSPLTMLLIQIDDMIPDTVVLTGTSYTYRGTLVYGLEKEIVGTSIITATVYDAAGQFATTSLSLTLNQAAQPLIGNTIQWVRRGATVLSEEEMANYGLKWENTYKAPFATIKPIEGANLFVCNGDLFESITTDVEKAAFFAELIETGTPTESYRNVDANQSADYNDMLAVVKDDLRVVIIIRRAEIETGSFGTQITIKGEAK